MKFTCSILSIYILFLTLAPSLPMVFASRDSEHCKKSCCLADKRTQKSNCPKNQQSGNCNNGICNPFMSCCNCYALTMQPHALSASSTGSNQKFNFIPERTYSNYLSDTWHPPKTV